MKITVKAKDLAPGLALATRAVATRSSMPLLSGVLIESEGSKKAVTLSATDMETSVRVPVAGASASAKGSVVVPARLLNDVVRSLPDEAEITLEHDAEAGGINLSAETPSKKGSSTSSYAMRCFAAADFPKLPDFSEEGAMSVPAGTFAYLADKSTKVASKDTTRPVLTSVLVESYDDALRAVSTDSYRLCVSEAHAEGAKGAEGPEDAARTALVTSGALREVARLAKAAHDGDKKETVAVSFSDSHACFRVGGAMVAGRLVAGNFPDYARLLPESFAGSLVLDRAALEDALSRVRPFAGAPGERASTPVLLSYTPPGASGTLTDDLELSAESSEIGAAREVVPVAGATGSCAERGMEMSFKPDYLADGLKLHADSKEVVLKVNDPLKPAIITPGEGGDGSRQTQYLIMPMRNPNAASPAQSPAPEQEETTSEEEGHEDEERAAETPAGEPVGEPVGQPA